MGEPLRSCIRGAEIIARVGDDIKLKGSLDYLGAVRHSGGFMTIRWWLGTIA